MSMSQYNISARESANDVVARASLARVAMAAQGRFQSALSSYRDARTKEIEAYVAQRRPRSPEAAE